MVDGTEEVKHDVQQDDSPAQTQPDAAPAQGGDVQESAQEGNGNVDGLHQDEAHPLEPDGKRFKQVWARAKSAEQAAETLKQELQREREERIRFEERLKAKEEAKKENEPEYSWDQLEAAIAEGKITRAWAQTYREGLVAKRTAEQTLRTIEERQTTQSTVSTIQTELDRYKRALPELTQIGTTERQAVEREYAYLTQVVKLPPTLQTELLAVRTAYGDVDKVEKLSQAKRQTQTSRESYMETQSTGGRPPAKTKDPVASLSSEYKAHYEKMIKAGRYSGWDEVRKELEFVPPSLAPKRR